MQRTAVREWRLAVETLRSLKAEQPPAVANFPFTNENSAQYHTAIRRRARWPTLNIG